MGNKKSIEDLVSSIYNLVNEAKEEFEKVKIKNIEPTIFTKAHNNLVIDEKSNDKSIYSNTKSKISNKNDEKVEAPFNWETIDFNHRLSEEIEKNVSFQSTKFDKDLIKEKFTSSLNLWIERNLKKIIESEFSNRIKMKND
mgnify:CR=1 FL=1